jgi:hypothetical protein
VYDSTSNSWSNAAPLPESRGDAAVAAYGGKLYIIGGQRPDFFPSNTVFEYDPVTNSYVTKNPMPTPQFEIGGAAVGNRIYVVGGYQYIHYAYDPVADSWSTMASPLTPSFSLPAVFAFGNELWVIGGRDNVSRHGYPPSQEVQIYNSLTNSWRFGPALNNPRYWSTAGGAINGRAYVAGGIDLPSEDYPYDYLNSMESISYVPCSTPVLVGHVTWQGRPSQPHALQQSPITLTLKMGATEVNFLSQNTDASGFFTAPIGSLASGTYSWRAKGPKFLANSGNITLTGGSASAEMGLMKAGDANNDNVVNVADFGILKVTFGKSIGDPGYDQRADFDGNNIVNIADFTLLKGSFGQGGAPPIGPK